VIGLLGGNEAFLEADADELNPVTTASAFVSGVVESELDFVDSEFVTYFVDNGFDSERCLG
jgi:hypothetical protein